MIKRILASTVAVLALAPAAWAANIGVVDFQALQDSAAAKKAQTKLQQAEANYQREMQSRAQKLDEAQRRNAKPEELTKMRQQYEKELQALRNKGEQDVKAATQAFQADLEKAVQAVAKAKHLDMVVRKDAMLFGGTDVTSDVEKQLAKIEEK